MEHDERTKPLADVEEGVEGQSTSESTQASDVEAHRKMREPAEESDVEAHQKRRA